MEIFFKRHSFCIGGNRLISGNRLTSIATMFSFTFFGKARKTDGVFIMIISDDEINKGSSPNFASNNKRI